MKLLLLSLLGLGVFVMSSCQPYGPHSSHRGGGGTYSTGYHSGGGYRSKIHPRQHGRYKAGMRTHAEKKYYRPL